MCSDIAIGFCSTWIKPFPILQIKFWDCAESRLFHKNANNSCLMMQWREKINLDITVIKCLFMSTPVAAWQYWTWSRSVYSASMSVSLTPGTSVHFVLGIFVSMEPADLENLVRGKKNNKKSSSQKAYHCPYISQLLSEYFSSVQFVQRWHSITLKMFLLSLERPVQSKTKGN